jgi:lipopolysaccharide assembly outer membrane protein LptD (OstA)
MLIQKGITLKWVEKGQIRMTAGAKSGRVNELTRTGELVDFSAKLYENGRLTSTMTAPKVVADTVNRTVTATGGVTMKSLDRATVVKADWMKWFAKEQKVIGDGGVKIDSHSGLNDYYTLEGAAFTADTALETLTVENSAKGIIRR